MKKCVFILLVLFLTVGFSSERDYQVQEREDIQKTLAFLVTAAEKKLIVDNIFGSITVEGGQSKEVKITVRKTIKAKNKDKLEQAKKEVSLNITGDGNTFELFVDGPFRNKEERDKKCESFFPGYEVHFDFDIKVPYETNLCLKTVTDGQVSVKSIESHFEVKNVNGSIELRDIAGSGIAHTVNGRVEASFVKNPQTDCSFKTINGDVKLLFQPDLSADFRIKSFMGDAFSDFPVSYLPSRPGKSYREKGKYVYKSDKMTGVRIGMGGPEIKMDTFTGDILIQKFK